MRLVGLSRQIVLTMMAMTLGVTLFLVLTSYAFYYLWLEYWPENFPGDTFYPTGPEWTWLIITALSALLAAALVAIKLSRRILLPLNSVIAGIRRLAQGDLTARAVSGDHQLGEATQLVDDFNVLASRLQQMTEEQAFWNAAIAHELRTPVTILRGRLQGLAEGVFAPDEAQFRRLLSQVEGLNQLIEDLRVVSLAESGHLSLRCQPVALQAEIRALAEMLHHPLAEAGQSLILDLQLTQVNCDPDRIGQALLALLENARLHALAGPVTIQLSRQAGINQLSVTDSGPGIAASLQAQVFTAFRRAPDSKAPGSGLGLAVVAAIARAHGGQASCQRTPDGGTRFTLSWPEDCVTAPA
jgi:two-component system sensor histidine kinase AdeS